MKNSLVTKTTWQNCKKTVLMASIVFALLLGIVCLVILSDAFESTVYAALDSQDDIQDEITNNTAQIKKFYNAVILTIGVSVLGGVALYRGIKVGLTFMSAEDAETKKKAKTSLFSLIIGIVIACCALGVVVSGIELIMKIFSPNLLTP